MTNDANDNSDRRHKTMAQWVPDGWERRPLALAAELRTLVRSIADEGSVVDSGASNGSAHLWVTSGGVEFFIEITVSKRQLANEAT